MLFLSLLQCLCFSSHLVKGTSLVNIEYLELGNYCWIKLNVQCMFNHQSPSFSTSPDLPVFLCNYSMNSYTGKSEIVSGHRGAGAEDTAWDQTQESALNPTNSERGWSRAAWNLSASAASSVHSALRGSQQTKVSVKAPVDRINQVLTRCLEGLTLHSHKVQPQTGEQKAPGEPAPHISCLQWCTLTSSLQGHYLFTWQWKHNSFTKCLVPFKGL